MGGLVSYFQTPAIRINVLGETNSGKSTLFTYLETGKFQQQVPNLHPKATELTYGGLNLSIFNFGSSTHAIKVLSKQEDYNKDVKAIFFMVDSCDRAIFDEVREDLHSYMECEYLKSVPFVIFATKQHNEKRNPATTMELREALNLKDATNECEIFPCDARFGRGIPEAFEWLKERI